MESRVVSAWACPEDGGPLRSAGAGLACGSGRHHFPVVDGIPCFVNGDRLDPHQRFERARRDRLVEFEGDRRLRYERRIEREAVVGRLQLGPDAAVLDAGCGAGHITRQLLKTGARVLAVDFSLARLQHLRRSVPPQARLELAVADVTRLPLAPQTLSAVVSTQVLEHIPSAEARRTMLRSFHRLLRPGGTLVLTAYNLSEPWRRRGAAAEGVHATGIFYHCYQAPELRRELEDFRLLELCGIINLFPHTYRIFPYLGRLARHLDHRGERHPALSQKWGHLLLAHALRCSEQ